MKIEALKKLGFKKDKFSKNYFLLIVNPEYIHWELYLWYETGTKIFHMGGIILNIKSLSDLKKFISYFKTSK